MCRRSAYPLVFMLDELVLAERLISYDTSRPEEIVAAAGFVKGWLESRDIEVRHHDHNGLPVLVAEVGPPEDGQNSPASCSTAISTSCPAGPSSSIHGSKATA